ncbi:MAG: hypothetical protein H7X80_08080, partial [bacterium]|nr:hypothetical protein [Candidatus Kapabacteria bacterium]
MRHFYFAHCPQGVVDVPSFGRITLRDVYPNIDMVLSGSESGMKCDFNVRPGGNPSDIRMRYVGSSPQLDDAGGVRASTPLGSIVESAPFTYQSDGTTDREVASRFIRDGDVISFAIASYDPTKVLVIDPVRRWSTFYGAHDDERLVGGDPTEVDRAGNVIITGDVNGTAFPVSNGATQSQSNGGA